jgi:hypothetical protein
LHGRDERGFQNWFEQPKQSLLTLECGPGKGDRSIGDGGAAARRRRRRRAAAVVVAMIGACGGAEGFGAGLVASLSRSRQAGERSRGQGVRAFGLASLFTAGWERTSPASAAFTLLRCPLFSPSLHFLPLGEEVALFFYLVFFIFERERANAFLNLIFFILEGRSNLRSTRRVRVFLHPVHLHPLFKIHFKHI